VKKIVGEEMNELLKLGGVKKYSIPFIGEVL